MNLGICLFLFTCLEAWRPYFFLTDDNLSLLFPLITDAGRHLQAGHSPLVSDYIFGGLFDLSRDMNNPFWHPFYLLPSLLADTPGRNMMMEITGLLFLLLAVTGLSFLAAALVREFNPGLPVGYIAFFIASCLFSTYVLIIGSSWIQFLGNLSALPWLTLGILQRRLWRGVVLISIFTLHELFGAYAPSTLYDGIFLSFFAAGAAWVRSSALPIFAWVAGNIIALLVGSPLLIRVLDGLAHSPRIFGVPVEEAARYAVPAHLYPFSYLLGNWTGLLARWVGETILQYDLLSQASVVVACGAAWYLFPALLDLHAWRRIEITLFALVLGILAITIRPPPLEAVMHHLPFVKSLRWPFRECLQLSFFLHLFFLVRRQTLPSRALLGVSIVSVAVFLLPLPFFRVPTLNPLRADREEVLSGKGEKFWSQVKTILKPGDVIATVIDLDLWKTSHLTIPYSLAGTANFPALYRLHCISGYSPTAPMDQVPLKTPPFFWFGAFRPEQMPQILAERPDLTLVIVTGVEPLRIVLQKDGKSTDLSPYVRN